MTELERALDDRNLERLHVGPLSPGALHAILRDRLGRVFARPTLLRLHEASGGNAFFALELARALPTDVDHTQPLPVPETLEVLVRARLDALPDATRATLLLACAHGRIQPALLDGDVLEPAFADNVIELADGAIRFTHPLLASVLYQNASPEARRSAHARLADIVDDPLARERHRALASDGPDADVAAALEEAGASRSPAVRRSSRQSSTSTPSALPRRRPRKTCSDARSSPPTHTWRPERAHDLARSRPSSWRRPPQGRSAPRRSCCRPSSSPPITRSRCSWTRCVRRPGIRRCRRRFTSGWPRKDE